MRFRIAPLLLAAPLLLCGCTAESNEQEPQETVAVFQTLPLPDLFVSIPEGYEESSSQFYDRFYVKDDAIILIAEEEVSSDVLTKDYSISALRQYQKMTNSLELLGNERIYAGPYPVEILEFTYTLQEGDAPMSTMVGYMSDGKSMFVITCKCSADTYTSHRDEFMTVIESQRPDKSWVGAAERAGE